MAATASVPTRAAKQPPLTDLIAGVILEARDLAATRAFYEPIFRDAPGKWQEEHNRLLYQAGPQSIEFVKRPHPRTFPDSGNHQAFRVRPSRLRGLVGDLERA